MTFTLTYRDADARFVLDGLVRGSAGLRMDDQVVGWLDRLPKGWAWRPFYSGQALPSACHLQVGGLCVEAEGIALIEGHLKVRRVSVSAAPDGLEIPRPPAGQPDIRCAGLRVMGGEVLEAEIRSTRGGDLWIDVKGGQLPLVDARVELIPCLPTTLTAMRQTATQRPTAPTPVGPIAMRVLARRRDQVLVRPDGPSPGLTILLWMLHDLSLVDCRSPDAVLKNLKLGLFVPLPRQAILRTAVHQARFADTQTDLAQAHCGRPP